MRDRLLLKHSEDKFEKTSMTSHVSTEGPVTGNRDICGVKGKLLQDSQSVRQSPS